MKPFRITIPIALVLIILFILIGSTTLFGQTKSIKNGNYVLRNELGFGRFIKIKDGTFKETSGGCTHSSYSNGIYKIINDSCLVLYHLNYKSSSVNLNTRYNALQKKDTLTLKYNLPYNSLVFSTRTIKEKDNKEFRKNYRQTKRETKKDLRFDKRRA